MSHTRPTSTQRGWSNRPNAGYTRLTGRRLQLLREELIRRSPYCAHCHCVLTLSSMERDHIVNLADGGTDDDSNVQALCIACHQAKTHAESNKARGITSKPRMKTGCDVRGHPLNPNHHFYKK